MRQFESIRVDGGSVEYHPNLSIPLRRRGRPKGATSASLSEVRAQAAEEKRRLREEMQEKIAELREQLQEAQDTYQQELNELRELLNITRKREESYRIALKERLHEVADHLHTTLLDWATAELQEGEVYKRKRGRPRKTLK
ncbi:MAG: DNA-binding protein [Thiofilum sp.]|uniref:DNA-binding protein n=1 Tax=Thiofilum sp. TaxID=2212733 RepID=UPI0025F52387|nr:DNA-binding protein [Thiofilum sp.]MBK8455004.1 DNA-binding protein [Thiofilum sp.]